MSFSNPLFISIKQSQIFLLIAFVRSVWDYPLLPFWFSDLKILWYFQILCLLSYYPLVLLHKLPILSAFQLQLNIVCYGPKLYQFVFRNPTTFQPAHFQLLFQLYFLPFFHYWHRLIYTVIQLYYIFVYNYFVWSYMRLVYDLLFLKVSTICTLYHWIIYQMWSWLH